MSWNTSRSLCDVGVLDRVQRLVDALAVARLVARRVERIEARAAGQHEALVLQHLLDQLGVIAVLALYSS